MSTGQIYQLYDFVVVDVECCAHTSSLPLAISRPSLTHLCPSCNKRPSLWLSDADSLHLRSDCCMCCQLFRCSECQEAEHFSLPSSLQQLPPFHLYWFQSLHQSGTFAVIRFREGADAVHPLVQSILACRCAKPIVFILLPHSLIENESVNCFISMLPSDRVILIPITDDVSPLLRSESNHLLKMFYSLSSSLAPPPIFSPLLFPLSSPEDAINIASTPIPPLPLQQIDSPAEKRVRQLHKSFVSPMQRLHASDRLLIAGAGVVVTQSMNGQVNYFYIPPHYSPSDAVSLPALYSRYQSYLCRSNT